MTEQKKNRTKRVSGKTGKLSIPKLTPFHQGDLDALCGLYSVTNAVRLAAFPVQKIGKIRSSQMIGALARTLGKNFDEVFEQGTNDVRPLLRAAKVWLRDTYGLSLTYTRPFRKHRRPTAQEIEAIVTSHLAGQGTSIIVSNPAHWSVVRSITPKSMVLFDSVNRAYFRYGSEKNKNEHRIIAREMLFLTVERK